MERHANRKDTSKLVVLQDRQVKVKEKLDELETHLK